jgi:uncharacterized membrane protein (UPF0182 family)
MADTGPLQSDIEAYCAALDGLLQHSAGKYVVFADGRLAQICDDYAAALRFGYSEFGLKTFLVQRVEPLGKVDFRLAWRR